MKTDPLSLAAQADLLLLTVEAFRPPPPADSDQAPWFELPTEVVEELLAAGLGAASTGLQQESTAVSPPVALAEVLRSARSLPREAWADEHQRLFEGATPCPLNQASYIRRDKGKILGDVSGFYHAFGWRGRRDSGERPDHLLSQLEFMALLLALAAHAPDAESYEVVDDALAKFAREHMHDWLAAVCWQLCEASQIEYYGAVAQWLLVLWQSLTDLHNWPADVPPDQRLQPIVDPDEPYECGAPDLHQIQT